MSGGAAAASASAGAAGAVANAIKASGAIVSVESREFETVLKRVEAPLVVCAEGGFLSRKYFYLTSYKGLIFHTKTTTPLPLPASAEVVNAKKIWVPSEW
jgi:hypothetical protein